MQESKKLRGKEEVLVMNQENEKHDVLRSGFSMKVEALK